MAVRDLPLVNAFTSATTPFSEAVAALFAAKVPALAVLDAEQRVVGIFSEGDLLRGVFPRSLAEVRHTAFLRKDPRALDEIARSARDRPVRDFLREVEPLDVDDSQIHAAERFIHSGEHALPVVENGRFAGMLSIAALCQARLDRADDG